MTISGFSLHLPHKWERRADGPASRQAATLIARFPRSFEVVFYIAVSSRQKETARHPRAAVAAAAEAPPEWQSANGAYDERRGREGPTPN